jgi:hypothetical protein
VIAKRPAPGQTKTRLTPPLTPESAAALYGCLLGDTLDLVRAVPGVARGILFAPNDADGYFGALAPDFLLRPQVGPDLGHRLAHGLSDGLNHHGHPKVIILDSDSPTLPVAYLIEAVAALDTHDAVFGPCDDGGYYLIGLSRPCPRLTLGVPMSTATVLADSLAIAAAEGLRTHLLPAWYDVDTVAELERLRREFDTLPVERARLTRAFVEDVL